MSTNTEIIRLHDIPTVIKNFNIKIPFRKTEKFLLSYFDNIISSLDMDTRTKALCNKAIITRLKLIHQQSFLQSLISHYSAFFDYFPMAPLSFHLRTLSKFEKFVYDTLLTFNPVQRFDFYATLFFMYLEKDDSEKLRLLTPFDVYSNVIIIGFSKLFFSYQERYCQKHYYTIYINIFSYVFTEFFGYNLQLSNNIATLILSLYRCYGIDIDERNKICFNFLFVLNFFLLNIDMVTIYKQFCEQHNLETDFPLIHYYYKTPEYKTTWLGLLGEILFLLSGGESNPGPIMSTLRNTYNTTKEKLEDIHLHFQNFLHKIKYSLSSIKEFGNLTIHLIRIFTSISDFIYSLLYSRTYSLQDFSFRTLTLIKNCYDTFTEFISNKKVVIAQAQSGAAETLTAGFMLSFLPDAIQKIFKQIPLYTNSKLLDDTDWVYSLIGSIISLPRLIVQCLPISTESHFNKLINLLYNIENLFPFSKLSCMLRKLNKHLDLVSKDPKLMVSKDFMDNVNKLEKESQELQRECKKCKRDLPSYSIDTFNRFTRLYRKIKANANISRPEPPCFIFDGPPGTGKTSWLNEIKAMYNRCGHSIYNYANIDPDAKLFFDSYDQSDIFVLDDISAVGYKLWVMLINMISPVPLSLPVADAKLKNSLYFNSQLVLGTANGIPSSFPSGTIGDKEALYRRLIRVNFSNMTFHNGHYDGYVTFEKYDSTPGVKTYIKYATVHANNGRMLLSDWDEIIKKEMHKSIEIFSGMITEDNYTPSPLPNAYAQSYTDTFNTVLDEIISLMPTWEFLITHIYEYIAEFMDNITNIYTDLQKEQLMIGTAIMVATGAGIYFSFTKIYNNYNNIDDNIKTEQEQAFSKVPLHYKSNKSPPKQINKIFAQAFIDTNSQVIPEVPQLKKYTTNLLHTSFQFLDNNNNNRLLFMNALFSGDKILTVFHPFSNNSNSAYITTYGRTGVKKYESMEVKMIKHSFENDWSIWQLPSTAPFYFSKIKFSLFPKTTKLYMATNETVIDLQDTVTDLNTSTEYTYDLSNFKSTLNDNDLIYDLEGDGMCGSILLTQDNCPIGLHSAKVRIDIDGVEYDKGVTKIFKYNDLITIHNILEDNTAKHFIIPTPELKENLYLDIITDDTNNKILDLNKNQRGVNIKSFPLYIYTDTITKQYKYLHHPNFLHNFILLFKFSSYKDLTRHPNCKTDFSELSGTYTINQTTLNNYTPTNTQYVKSPIYGIYPTLRKPAYEAPKEQHNLKMLSEQLMVSSGNVELSTLTFSEEIIDQILPISTQSLTEYELVKGNHILNRVDPDTSTGFNIQLDKRQCLNYEEGKLTTEYLQNYLQPFITSITNNTFTYDNYAKLTRKDELKDIKDLTDHTSLPKKVRVFTACDINQTILLRFFLGDLMGLVMKDKFVNGIMIGLNPLSHEWTLLIQKLHKISKNNIFDGDYSSFDKGMQPIFQRKLNKILKNKININYHNFNNIFQTNLDKQQIDLVLDQLLEWLISTPIISEKQVFQTTHGMPSGSALTAFYNSLINVMYISYVYKTLCPSKSYSAFFLDISYCVYGDDLILSVSDNIKDIFTPINFSQVIDSLGLGFTPAEKGLSWHDIPPFKHIEKCSFLKRSFQYHPKLGEYVAPLSLVTVTSSLNYITDSTRSNELTLTKMNNFQREMFLHYDIYEHQLKYAIDFAKTKNINYIPLTEQQLIKLYHNNLYHEFLLLS